MLLAAAMMLAVSVYGADKVQLRYVEYSANGAQEETLAQMIKAFEKANPDVTVKYEIVDWHDYYTKLNTTLSSKAAPDVFEVGYENFVQYAQKGLLLDLGKQAGADKSFKAEVYKPLAYKAFSYQGKQMGVPEKFSDVVLVYNKSLFDKAGIQAPQPNWTWKDELAAAQKLTDASKGVWGTFSPIQFWEFYKTIAQNGGAVYDSKNKVVVDSVACVEALQWMFDKSTKYKVSPPLDDDIVTQADADVLAFKEGRIAMFRTGIWNLAKFADAPFEWDIALEPGNTAKAHHFFTDGLVVGKDTKNAQAAWRFVKFMTSDPEVQKMRVDANWDLPAVTDEKVFASYLAQTPPKSRKVVLDALDSLVLPPLGPIPARFNDVASAAKDEFDKARLGKQDCQAALTNLRKAIEAIVASSK
jgi:ABC-type sugar transport system, periplasmic component